MVYKMSTLNLKSIKMERNEDGYLNHTYTSIVFDTTLMPSGCGLCNVCMYCNVAASNSLIIPLAHPTSIRLSLVVKQ